MAKVECMPGTCVSRFLCKLLDLIFPNSQKITLAEHLDVGGLVLFLMCHEQLGVLGPFHRTLEEELLAVGLDEFLE